MKRRKNLISGLIAASMIGSTLIFPGNTVQAATSVKVNSTNFPDKYFRSYVKSKFDKDSNGTLDLDELKGATKISCIEWDIESLKGIENLPYVEYIDCIGNKLGSLDLSSNTKLKTLVCDECELTTLNITGCDNLVTLECDRNQLTSLKVSSSTKLNVLSCNNNAIKSLNLSYNTNLTSLDCSQNNLTKLNLANNTKLESLICSYNLIETLDISANTKLTVLECNNNKLSSLDVNKLENLESLSIANNNISSIDVSKNPNLFLLACESNNISTLDVSQNPELLILSCAKNNLTSINLGQTSHLNFLNCSYNKLTSLDVSKHNLTALYCEHNQLETLKLMNDGRLQSLICNDNKLTTQGFTSMPNLRNLTTFHNNILSLDLESTAIYDSNWGHTKDYDVVISNINHCNIASDDVDSILELYKPEGTVLEDFNRIDIDDTPVYFASDILIVDETTKVIGTRFELPVVTSVPTVTTPTPSKTPSSSPTTKPTVAPNATPTASANPTNKPAANSTSTPAVSGSTTASPTSSVVVTPNSKPTSKPSGAPSNKPSNNPSGSTASPEIPVDEASVEDFAERLYTTCLGRDSEKDGKAFWVTQLKAGMAGSEVAEGFFFSPEFVGLNLSNEEYITRLYRTFMGREPDKDGINYWLDVMKKGQGRVFVFEGFVNSIEWADICLSYGIRSGGLAAPSYEKTPSAEIKAFAQRLYTTCLGRDAEPDGLLYWSKELANLRQTGTVAAQGFFFSEEFIKLNLTDEEYVTRLYRTFMGREPEGDGFDYWISELKSGKSRQDVFDGFSVAPEFANLCAAAGILR